MRKHHLLLLSFKCRFKYFNLCAEGKFRNRKLFADIRRTIYDEFYLSAGERLNVHQNANISTKLEKQFSFRRAKKAFINVMFSSRRDCAIHLFISP